MFDVDFFIDEFTVEKTLMRAALVDDVNVNIDCISQIRTHVTVDARLFFLLLIDALDFVINRWEPGQFIIGIFQAVHMCDVGIENFL